jgi:hypothetical protein
MFNLFKKKSAPPPDPPDEEVNEDSDVQILEVPHRAPAQRVQLGDLVRDAITSFEGIVTAKSEFLNKCVRLQVQPQGLKDGKTVKPEVFDEEQLIIIKPAAYTSPKPSQTGGDHKMPGRAKRPF